MQTSPLEHKLTTLLSPSLEGMGYRIVRIRLFDNQSRRTLQIMADRLDGRNITVDDCAKISYQVSALLDVEDPIAGAYHLEVSSPGIDRPLVCREDFEAYTGHEAKLETVLPIEGRRRFRGTLQAMEGDTLILDVDGQHHRLALENIGQAKLVLTDALIKEYQDKEKQQENI